MNRKEHLEWCKERARAYVDSGDFVNAVASIVSDLGKHDGTRSSINTMTISIGTMAAMSNDRRHVLSFIEGFN